MTTAATSRLSRADHDGPTRAARTTALFEQLAACEDASTSDEIVSRIIEANMGLAETLARRYFGHGERSEDLRQTAYLALSKAVTRADPVRGKDFLAFAVPTVLGELRRHFRDSCWTVRPPRRVQELQPRLMKATEQFAQEHGRNPKPSELAEELAVDLDDVTEAMTAHGCFTPTSLDEPLGADSDARLADVFGGNDAGYHRAESRVLITPLVKDLPARDRRIIERRFFHDWTQREIADEIGVTQMQVSRLLTRILEQMRQRLEPPLPAAA